MIEVLPNLIFELIPGAIKLENYLISMASQGKLGSQISDEQLKQILLSMQQPKRDFKINRV